MPKKDAELVREILESREYAAGEIPPSTLKEVAQKIEDETLKHRLLGPSLTKSGQDSVDQKKVGLTQCYCALCMYLIGSLGRRDNLQCLKGLEILQQ